MSKMQSYWVKGNTYAVKDEIKAVGGKWFECNQSWRVANMMKGGRKYSLLKSLGLRLVPCVLSAKAQKIQNILNK